MNMRRKFPGLCACALALALVLAASPGAEAAPITGAVSFGGAFTPTGGTGLADATGVDVIGDIAFVTCAISATCTGTFAPVTGAATATYHDFTFDPLGGSTTPLWSFTHLGVAYSFDLLTVSVLDQSSTVLGLAGTGILHVTGFDDTAGKWSFSGDTSGGGVFAFSSTTSAVPEPASVLLLGLSLLGGSAAMRRRVRVNR